MNSGKAFLRSFGSVSFALQRKQKSLIQKIASSNTNRNTFSLAESTSLYFQWLFSNTRSRLQKYEDDILKTLEFDKKVVVERSVVAGINQIKFSKEEASITTPTVLVHGHAASGIFYHRNFRQLSSHIQNLYAIDLPDVGLSDNFNFKPVPVESQIKLGKDPETKQYDSYEIIQDLAKTKESVRSVQDHYTSALDNWRKTNNLEKLNIVAHSFGGYLSFQYALKYPQHVSKLILVSPAGVERSIFSINNPESKGVITNTKNPNDIAFFRSAFVPEFISRLGFTITKIFGPFGVKLISKYLSFRYSRGSNNDEQIQTFIKYTIFLFYQSGISYKNLKVLLTNQILALDPILDHIEDFNQLHTTNYDGLQGYDDGFGSIPVYFLYGAVDWMNSQAGYLASQSLKNSKFDVVENAGHNVFLDNADEFDSKVLQFLKE